MNTPEDLQNNNLHRRPRVYVAGKISKDDWRLGLYSPDAVPQSPEEWRATHTVEADGFDYIGPFFIRCDHGCGHGPISHGVDIATRDGCGGCISMSTNRPVTGSEVVAKSRRGIDRSDFVVIFADCDFDTAFASIWEAGYAIGRRKPLIVIAHPDVNLDEHWFLKESATVVVSDADPIRAIRELSQFWRRTGKPSQPVYRCQVMPGTAFLVPVDATKQGL